MERFFLKPSGIKSLIKLILKLEKEFGEKKLLEIASNNPDFYLGFLDDNLKIDLESYVKDLKSVKKKPLFWSEENITDILKKIELTELQKNILIQLSASKKEISMNQLIENNRYLFPKVEHKKDRKEGSIIGGALSGLTRKCLSNNIKVPYESIRDEDGNISYKIVDEAKFITHYL